MDTFFYFLKRLFFLSLAHLFIDSYRHVFKTYFNTLKTFFVANLCEVLGMISDSPVEKSVLTSYFLEGYSFPPLQHASVITWLNDSLCECVNKNATHDKENQTHLEPFICVRVIKKFNLWFRHITYYLILPRK